MMMSLKLICNHSVTRLIFFIFFLCLAPVNSPKNHNENLSFAFFWKKKDNWKILKRNVSFELFGKEFDILGNVWKYKYELTRMQMSSLPSSALLKMEKFFYLKMNVGTSGASRQWSNWYSFSFQCCCCCRCRKFRVGIHFWAFPS